MIFEIEGQPHIGAAFFLNEILDKKQCLDFWRIKKKGDSVALLFLVIFCDYWRVILLFRFFAGITDLRNYKESRSLAPAYDCSENIIVKN